jgi:HAD superfamily hydrolase (TIGR01509 family)
MTQIDTIIFDLDGTLIDTEPTAARAVERCFQDWKITPDAGDSAYVTGRTWANAFEFLFSKYKIPLSKEQAITQAVDLYRKLLEENLPLVPGSVAAVEALAPHFRLGLVSGSHRREILWALGKMGVLKHFQVVLGSEDYPKSKPAPDGYLAAMKTLKTEGARTLIFEDSTAGIASGRAARAWVVGITSTNHFSQSTNQAHDHIADLRPVTAEWVTNLSKKLK